MSMWWARSVWWSRLLSCLSLQPHSKRHLPVDDSRCHTSGTAFQSSTKYLTTKRTTTLIYIQTICLREALDEIGGSNAAFFGVTLTSTAVEKSSFENQPKGV